MTKTVRTYTMAGITRRLVDFEDYRTLAAEAEALKADRDRFYAALEAIVDVQDNSEKMYAIASEALAKGGSNG